MLKKIFYCVIVVAVLVCASAFAPNTNVAFADAQSDIEKYSAQINANPNNATAYYNRGVVYYKSGNYNQAISDHTNAIQFKPNYAEAYHARGLAYKAFGNNARAQADFKKAKELGYNG